MIFTPFVVSEEMVMPIGLCLPDVSQALARGTHGLLGVSCQLIHVSRKSHDSIYHEVSSETNGVARPSIRSP
jgi:hypothetical protein